MLESVEAGPKWPKDHRMTRIHLRKSPAFQLYLITKAPNDRARMERSLMEIQYLSYGAC
jgi:hypothetical protein